MSFWASCLLFFAVPRAHADACFDSIQNKIAWDAEGKASTWMPANVQRLCAGAEDSKGPGQCFRGLLGRRAEGWTWQDAIALCAGVRDPGQTLSCYDRLTRSGADRKRAIAGCQGGASSAKAPAPAPAAPAPAPAPGSARAPAPASVAGYASGPAAAHRPMASQSQPPSGPVAASTTASSQLDGAVGKSKRAGTDLTVFGIPLGEPLSLPPCGEASVGDLFGALAGVGRGGPTTCVGDPGMTMANSLMAAAGAFLGAPVAPEGVDMVAVQLADKQCPSWMKQAGSCAVTLAVRGQVPIGAVFLVGVGGGVADEIESQLDKKYKQASKPGRTWTCDNPALAREVSRSEERVWRPSGLVVTYLPNASGCSMVVNAQTGTAGIEKQRGRVTIDLEAYHTQEAGREAATKAGEGKI